MKSDWAKAFSNLEKCDEIEQYELPNQRKLLQDEKSVSGNIVAIRMDEINEYTKMKVSPFDNGKRKVCPRALNIKGRNTKLIRIGKTK